LELFPQATQILDRFRAKEHLSQVGKIIYGDCPEGKPWIQARYGHRMRQGFCTSTGVVEAVKW